MYFITYFHTEFLYPVGSKLIIYCRQQEEPTILISRLVLKMHAQQLCSLALTQFLLNSWVFHYESMECTSNRECQRRTIVPLDAILWPHSASSELWSVVPLPQAWNESECCSCFTWKFRDCCSSDLLVFDLTCKCWVSLKILPNTSKSLLQCKWQVLPWNKPRI